MNLPLANKPPGKFRRGATIVEGVMALTIFSLALGMGGMVVNSTEGAYAEVQSRVSAGMEVRQQTDRIADELASISKSYLYPVPEGDWGTSYLYFRQVEDIQDNKPVWGARSVIFLAYEDGEENDGRDNNGNGLADECRILLARNLDTPDQTIVTLMHGLSEYAAGEKPNGYDDNENGVLDEHGLSFHLDGNVMTVRMTSVELDSANNLVEHTSQRSFRLMN